MIIFCSGIHGNGGKDYLRRFEAYCKESGKSAKIYRMGEMVFEQAQQMGIKLSRDNILNTSPMTLKALRAAVFERILGEIGKDDVVIIDSHATFLWKGVFFNAFDWEYITRLQPDLFVTIIDCSNDIAKRLDSSRQWKDQGMGTKDVLLWQNVEVNNTSGLAEQSRKPFYAIPARQSANTLYRLIFHPEMKPVYLSYPMTNLKNPVNKKLVDEFIQKMEKYFVIFDPGTIEVEMPSKEDRDIVFNHITHRDLFWLVAQSEKVIAFMPEVVYTSGVDSELKEAHDTNKDVWMVFPNSDYGPFTHYYNQKVFSTIEELEKFIQERGYEPLTN